MKTILITNVEAQFYIEDIEKILQETNLEKKYEILPDKVNMFLADPMIVFGAVEATYALILIMEFGFKTVKKMVEEKKDRNLNKITNLKQDEKENNYSVEIDGKSVSIHVENKENNILIKINQ